MALFLRPSREVISIDLVAAPPAASRPSRRSPAPPPPKAPAAEPPPSEPPPPTPPVVKAPVQVLPEESPGRIRKVKPEPKPAPPRPKREKELSLEDPESSAASQSGAVVSPELAAWNLATRRRIQNTWVTPSNFRNRGLATTLELRLSASGDVIGTPKVVRSSGDPFFDDNAVRAVLTAAPLPPPPKPGRRSFTFNAEGN